MLYDVAAKINTDQCIGCTRCIKACPVDAIIGAPKRQHQILDSYCTGCEDCVAVCPVDCIDLVDTDYSQAALAQRQAEAEVRTVRQNQRRATQKQRTIKPTLTAEDTIQADLANILARAKAKRQRQEPQTL